MRASYKKKHKMCFLSNITYRPIDRNLNYAKPMVNPYKAPGFTLNETKKS
jgi:hypothetical protein